MPIYLDGPVIQRGLALEQFETPFQTYLKAKFDDAWDNNITPLLAEDYRVRTAGQGAFEPEQSGTFDAEMGMGSRPAVTKMPAVEARQKVKDASLNLNIPEDGINSEALDILMKRKVRQRGYEDAIARSPTGMRSVAGIGAQLVAGLLDPLNVASAFVPVVGEARYTAMLARASGLMGRTGVRAGVGAMEGAVGMAMLEPATYAAHSALQDDYKMLDSIINIGFGGVLGGGLHVAGGAFRDVIGGSRRWAKADVVVPEKAGDPVTVKLGVAEPVKTPLETMARTVDEAVPESVTPGPLRFTTAKGSTYEVLPDGSTVRDKAARPEHPGESGPQPKSDTTFYVTPEDAQTLGEFQVQGGSGKRSVELLPTGEAGVRYVDGKDAGKFEGRTVVAIQKQPAVGLIPVELWDGGKKVHFGNEITQVSNAPSASQVVQAATPQQREAALRTAIAQATDGRTPNVTPIFDPNASVADVLRHQASPDSERLADPVASRIADEAIKSEKSLDLKTAQAEADQALAKVEERWAATGRDPAELKRLMPGLDEMTKQADELAAAARAAALCDTGA
jgi:hypothetical protein